MRVMQSRRGFVASAAAASLLGSASALADEGPPETTTIRIGRTGICVAPQYIADELLRAEGFTDVRHISVGSGIGQAEALARRDLDITMTFAPALITPVDAGEPITILAGVHVGCFELFASKGVRGVADLRGKSVGVPALGTAQHLFVAGIAAYVGLDAARDIDWVTSPLVKPLDLFVEGKIDAFLGFPPEPQELRARNIGRVIVNSAIDRPWSQYFCCMLAGNVDYVRKYPIATKRAMRAILKAADLCVSEPERVARWLVDSGFTPRYDYALQMLNEVPYDKWRDYDPEDTIRFYALRLHEAGFIKSSPNRLIAEGTDWRFLNEIKRELKA
jgi:NitT/TauT family transport system substrate-binding protein